MFLFQLENNYLIILLIYKTQPQQKSLKNYQRLCFKHFAQLWTKLVETKVGNQVNSRNASIFQIPNSPPDLFISMLDLVQFCCQNNKALETTLIWGERGFFTEKQIFYFVSTVLSKIVGYLYLFKKPSETVEKYCNACWWTVCFKCNQFEVIKMIYLKLKLILSTKI